MKLSVRIAVWLVAVAGVWLAVLVVLGMVYGGRYGQGIADRMAESLKADGSVADSDLALVRGRLQLDAMHVVREDAIGRLALDVREVRCELQPLGIALVDRDCLELAITGMRLVASSFALFKVPRPKRPPIHAGWVTIDDAVLAIDALGDLGRGAVQLSHVEAGPTTFKSPLSWLFNLDSLRATLDLPVPFGKIEIQYRYGVLSLTGGMFAQHPFVRPIALPVQDLAEDAPRELARIGAWGKELATQIVHERMPMLYPR